METEKRKLSELKPRERNVRKHTDKQINEFEKSIKSFGVLRPIVIDENNVILAGHGLFNALTKSGAKDADVLVIKGLSEKDKKKLMLTDNKIYSLGFDDYSSIETILKELADENDFEIPGYDADILEDLYGIKSVEKDAETGNIGIITDKDVGIVNVQNQQIAEVSETKEPTAEIPEPSQRFKDSRKEAEDSRKFVICPNCGEKIWL